MSVDDFYGEGARRLQDTFETRRLADHIEERYVTAELDESAAAIVRSADCFFLATANAAGHPDCSYKGGFPGFLEITGPGELAFPSYDGNGMYRSLGNILENPYVGILIVDYQRPIRLRINGEADVSREAAWLDRFQEAEAVVRVRVTQVFENCPRYLHTMVQHGRSAHVPRPGHVPPDPEWKLKREYDGLLTRRHPGAARMRQVP